ncbi:Sugar transporter [Geodermatophilus obscurus]|uniref:Sugar transporter n=1 Tax=Geodermatophilus obscurus TaxID=1861 RepID=A0A1M7U4B6_9ACTN|nr:MFS transporter [Geodermatophilus obscurus]SHN77815.1 Sugar transporter [Geodermatophilus obscurus]
MLCPPGSRRPGWVPWPGSPTVSRGSAALRQFGLVVVGAVVHTLRTPEEWALSGTGATAVITIGLAGMMVGALTIGTLIDLVGRRKSLIGAVTAFSLLTLLCAFAPAAVFGLLRFLAGTS